MGWEGLAVERMAGEGAGFFFLTGLRSSMRGEKAEAIHRLAVELGAPMTRFDYSGHGESPGAFEDGSIGQWLQDALDVFDSTDGPMVLVGSSMGGWLATHLALRRPARVTALMTLAAAPDFPTELLEPQLTDAHRAALVAGELLLIPSRYEDRPYPLRASFLDDARTHRLLTGSIPLHMPALLVHGQQDIDVPVTLSRRLAAALESPDVTLVEIKDGTHRLSRPQDLETISALARHLWHRAQAMA